MKTFIRKQIKKYLKKHLTVHPKNYYFLRWLVELSMDVNDKNNLYDVCAAIGGWMCQEKQDKLLIYTKDIILIDNVIYIYTYRPGLWIGKSGSIVNSCQKSLNYNINNEKINDYKIEFIEETKTPYTYILKCLQMKYDY